MCKITSNALSEADQEIAVLFILFLLPNSKMSEYRRGHRNSERHLLRVLAQIICFSPIKTLRYKKKLPYYNGYVEARQSANVLKTSSMEKNR